MWDVLKGIHHVAKIKASLPQVPKNMKYDRMSEEFAAELNNSVSLEEQAWANAINPSAQGNTKINKSHLIPLFERGFKMNRNQANSTQVTYKDSSQQVSSPILSDGIDEEFSEELADHDDKEAQARAKAANQRAKKSL